MWRRRLGRERAAKVDQAARQRHIGRAPPSHPAAVVGDLKGTSLVIIQTAAWRRRERSRAELVGKTAESTRVRDGVSGLVPSHLRPCRTRPHSISPQWSQKAGARYEWTNRQWGRIWKSSTVAEAAGGSVTSQRQTDGRLAVTLG